MKELLQWTVLPGMKLNTAMKLGLKKAPKSNHRTTTILKF
jgi:hypothetical protein